jgi:hypothetical protein
MEKMSNFFPLETPDLKHLLAVFHPQPVDLIARPVVFEKNLRGYRLTMPWRRGLAHEENVGLLGRHGWVNAEMLKC